MTNELFKTRHNLKPMAVQDERDLIWESQDGNPHASWKLLVQYSGLLQSTMYNVTTRVRSLTPEQIEDIEQSLLLAALETIKAFDHEKFIRLSQVLPHALQSAAFEMTTALHVPRGTLDLWFKIWRAAAAKLVAPAYLAPTMGMSANTFRAIHAALDHVDSEWARIPYSPGKPTPSIETHTLAHAALSILAPAEREVIELFYGFRGDTKTDQEVANIRGTSRVSAVQSRQLALTKMRKHFA